MTRRHILTFALAALLLTGAITACGGSSSTSTEDTSSAASSEGSAAPTSGPTTTEASVSISIVYKSCAGSTLTIATKGGTGEITGVEISRDDAAKTDHRAKMTKNADGTWTGTIPSGAGYTDRISVIATSSTGRKSTRSSPLPLTVEDGSTSTCI